MILETKPLSGEKSFFSKSVLIYAAVKNNDIFTIVTQLNSKI